MKKYIITFLIAFPLIYSSTVNAQDSVFTKTKTRKFFWEMTGGYSKINLDKLNKELAELDLKESETSYKYFSIALGQQINRFHYRGEFHIGEVSFQEQLPSVYSQLTGYGLNAGIGYALIDKIQYRIQTYIGLNGNNFSFRFKDYQTYQAGNVAELIDSANSSYGSGLYFGGTSLELATQFDYLISRKNKRWGCPQESRSFNVGIRLGYRLPLRAKGTHNSNTYDTPVGPYVSLVLGSIRTKKALDWK